MKKLHFILVVLLLFSNIACNNLIKRDKEDVSRVKGRRSRVIVKEKESGSRIPVPKFDDIELYLRESYNDVSMDNVRRTAYVNESEYLDIRTKELILEGKVRLGMFKEDVSASLGAPDKKIKNITEFGVKEKWLYPLYFYIFENGILIEIKEI